MKFNPKFIFWFLLMSSLFYYQAGWKGVAFGLWLVVLIHIIVELIQMVERVIKKSKPENDDASRLFNFRLLYVAAVPLMFYLIYLLIIV
jgi:hypothetical protein